MSYMWDDLDDGKASFPDIETQIRFRGAKAFQDACRDNDMVGVSRCLEKAEAGRLDLGTREISEGFLAACYSGHFLMVSHLVSNAESIHLDVNYQDTINGRTGFIAACLQCPSSIVSLLVSKAAELRIDVNLQDNSGRTGFIAACIRGDSFIVSQLVENAAEIGLDANIQDKTGITGLMGACAYDRSSVVSTLVLNAEAINLDIHLQDKNGETPFEHCVKYKRIKPLLALAPFVDTARVRPALGDVTAAAYCVERRLHDTLSALGMFGSRQFRACSETDQSALSIAYDRGDAVSIQIMTEARRNRHVEAVRSLFDVTDVEELQDRLENDKEFVSGVDWVVLDHNGNTIVHHFLAEGDAEIRDLLWDKIGSIDKFMLIKNARGSNVLLAAFIRGDVETIEWLSQRTETDYFLTARVVNSSLRDKNKNKMNCFDVASEDSNLWTLLVERFAAAAASIENIKPNDVGSLIVRAMNSNPANLDAIRFISDPWRDIKIDWTVVVPVMFSRRTSNELLIQFLEAFLRYLPIDRDETGMTVLHRACERGCLELVQKRKHLANINVANLNGETPIYAAAKNGHLTAITFLLTEDQRPILTVVNPEMDDPDRVCVHHEFNETPAEVAASCGFEEIVTLFRSFELGIPREIEVEIASEDTKSEKSEDVGFRSGTKICGACGIGNVLSRSSCQACFSFLEMDDSKEMKSEHIDRVSECLRAWRENGEEMLAFIQDPFTAQIDALPSIWMFARDPRTGDTALHVACRSDRPDAPAIIRVLLENGARISCTNQMGETPLLTSLRTTRVYNTMFLLTQRLSEFLRRDLEMSLDEAQRIGVIDDLLRRIRLRHGAKYSDDMPVKVERLNKCRGVAKMMSEFMLDEEIKDIWRAKKDRCNSVLYQSLKSQIMRAFERHEPFSDDNLMAVLVHARDYHEDEYKAMMGTISDKEDFCLINGNKERMAFIWFETFLSVSAIYHEGDSRAKLVTKIDLLTGRKENMTDLETKNSQSTSGQCHLSADETAEICEAVLACMTEWAANEPVARQDCIPHAITITDDPLIQVMVDNARRDIRGLMKEDNNNADNMFLHDYDMDVYLDRLLLTAGSMKGEFDELMKKIETKMKATIGEDSVFIKCVPVKLAKRTKEKVGKYYNDGKGYPSSARILDLMRCSFTFENVPLMLEGLRILLQSVAEGKREFESSSKARSGLIGVARIENMFEDGKQGLYRDVKVNVTVYSAKFGKSLIAEVQFILHDFLLIKKSEHSSFHSIIREQEIFDIGHATATEDYFLWKLINAARLGDSKGAGMALLLGADVSLVTNEEDKRSVAVVAPVWTYKDDRRLDCCVIPSVYL